MENSTNTVQHDGQTLHIGSEAVFVDVLPNCDIHPDRPAVYDAKTKGGPWGYLCEPCFDDHDCHLGLGRGQYLILRATGE